ncbi:hypothetical protein [Limnohabitans sp.]|uniref:hypothetical protein n=1 Tax=Limnohabitans sp. TaxID=1907725 RepID=UPI002AFE85E6|nr:hypothetical protein [Limnohabitans sp.]
MTTFYGTPKNDYEVVRLPMAFTYDGLAGVDTMSFGTSERSAYTITQASDGAVWVDSVSGASDILNAKLYNVETIKFNDERDVIDLATYFLPTVIAPPAPTPNTTGTAQNDLLSVTTASATVDGLAGIDTVTLNAAASTFKLQAKPTGNLTSYSLVRQDGTGTVSLTNVERLTFTDQKLALDLNGNAGSVAKILGAVFGASAVARPDFVGIGLSLLDSGQYNATTLMGYALEVALSKNASPQSVVDLLYRNVVGVLPDAQTQQSFVDLISANSPAWLGNLAATHPLNEANIQLTGLQLTGLAFV